jgi:isopenicillin N synthase-like dioxygenase
MSLPVLDLSRWREEKERDRRSLASELRSAAASPGFFHLVNHGVPETLIETVRGEAKRFFSQPLEKKLAIHFEKARRQRGYIPLRAESSDPAGGGDVKEALDFTYPVPPEGVSEAVAYRMHGPNLWPDLPGFRQPIERYFDSMISLGRTLFQIIATSLELERDYFADKTDRPIAQLRLLRYPPRGAQLGIGAHCDYECFTILSGGATAGLEIQLPSGEWLPVDPLPGTFVVNFGEMLARWTNDVFRATPHRVRNRSGKERYSIPFFFGTNYETWIERLPTCGGPERYAPIQAGDYLARRLNEVYGSLPEVS